MTTSSATVPSTLPLPPFTLLADRVLILPDKEPEMSRGGIIIPETANRHGDRELLTGRVVKVGPGMLMANGDRFPMADCKIGDRVAYYKHGTVVVKIEEVKYLSMRDDNVHAVLEPEPGDEGYVAP
jgi:co-chaperonin GroES (HSP10)